MMNIAFLIREWLAERNIDDESFTFIINIKDSYAAAHFHAEVGKEMKPFLKYTDSSSPFSTNEFQIYGIRFKIESPFFTQGR